LTAEALLGETPAGRAEDMKRTLSSIALALTVCGLLVLGETATASTRADTTVTIKTQNGDFWGYVSSPRPLRCAKGRKVILFKQVGTEQSPSTDPKMGSDTAELNGDRYRWDTGNSGLFGKYYARAPRTELCKADSSPTVRSVRT
jgi:hypothetical protein